MNFIASPEIVVALALAGRLSFNPLTDALDDGSGQTFRLTPPTKAPETPPDGFDAGRAFYHAPPEDGSDVAVEVAPDSERLQILEPFPRWDGEDIVGAPALIKTAGKCTTDHISPAGPWLRYRGHLERFSDNMFMGATNAFTGDAGTTANAVTGERGQAVSRVARDYKARGLKWVVVGDDNYGEGSSREHAALSPRLLGGAAVIVRSFARIHESNLKKQGLLALTFSDPADYDLVREDDRIDILGLDALAESEPVRCVLRHSDGTTDTLSLRHSYSESQLAWFRAGSALNLFHQ